MCLVMGVILDKYEKKLSTLMGTKCLVVRDEVNMQACTIVHKCAKNKREVFFKSLVVNVFGGNFKNDMQLVQSCCLVMGLGCTIK